MDNSPPGFSVHGISQTRILEWVAISSSRGSSRPRDQTVSFVSPALVGGFFTTAPPQKPLNMVRNVKASIAVQHIHIFSGILPQGALVVKNLPVNAGDTRDTASIPGLGRSPGAGSGHPLQYSCLGNPMDRAAWWATVHRVAESDTTE